MPGNYPRHHAWACALARLQTWLAGTLYRRRRDEWWADLRYAQAVEEQTSILKAASWLGSVPGLALRDAAAAREGRWRQSRAAGWRPVSVLRSHRFQRVTWRVRAPRSGWRPSEARNPR